MKRYFQNTGNDAASSIVVFLIAIPLCLGVAVASGLPEFSGIIAGIIGGIVIGSLSGSQLSVSGPAAGLTAIVAAAVLKLPAIEAFFLAVMLAGVLQLLMGVFRLGTIGDFIPNSVIKGMLAAIGVILILKQLPHLFGYDADHEGDQAFIQASGENTFSFMISSMNHISPAAVIIGVAGLLILILYESDFVKGRWLPKLLSAPLMVVIISVAISMLLANSSQQLQLRATHFVHVPVAGSAKEFISFFHFPDWSFILNKDIWLAAIMLALVASLETLLGIEAVDKMDPLKRVTPPNRELIAQGCGNIVSGLLGGLPLTSVIVRSSANVNAGARTRMSTIFHGLLILISVVFIPGILNLIPKAALAAILIFTGYKLAKISFIKEYYQKGWDQFIPFVVTLTAIVFTDLLTGVIIGTATGIFYIFRSNFRTAILVVQHNDNYLIRLRKDVSFFSKSSLKKKLENVPPKAKLVIDATRAEFIDQDISDTINEFVLHAHIKEIRVKVKRSLFNNSGTEAFIKQPDHV